MQYSDLHVKEIVERVGVISKEGKENKIYPDVTLHEIITNAVLHHVSLEQFPRVLYLLEHKRPFSSYCYL